MATMNKVKRISDNEQPFMDRQHWSCIQGEGSIIDDGRLASLNAYLSANTASMVWIYYRDNGSIFVASSSWTTVEIARAYVSGFNQNRN